MPFIVAVSRAPAVTRSSSNGAESSVKGRPTPGELHFFVPLAASARPFERSLPEPNPT
jgi:hypothetical protein